MENATKALLIAAGILLTILLTSLLIYAWGNFSEFYRNQDKIDEIEELAKFNSQFTNFDRDDVHGYDIVSLANKISDYNTRFSDSEGSRNSKNYSPITLTVILKNGDKDHTTFWYPDQEYDNDKHLFTTDTYTQKTAIDGIVNEIKEVIKIEQRYGQAETASKLAKKIGSLLAAEDEDTVSHYASLSSVDVNAAREKMKKEAAKEYKYITGEEVNYEDMKKKLLNPDSSILKYYEYYQFKRGIFMCEDIDYDDQIGRVKSMTFRFTGTIE